MKNKGIVPQVKDNPIQPLKKGGIILEDIKAAAEYVFREKEKTNERVFKLNYSCITNGWATFNPNNPFFNHCGNVNCPGCNSIYNSINDALKDWVKQAEAVTFKPQKEYSTDPENYERALELWKNGKEKEER